MSVLTAKELQKVRNRLEREVKGTPINYDKPIINLAIQFLEDWYEGEKATVSAGLNAATAPMVLTNSQKKKLGGAFLVLKALKELL